MDEEISICKTLEQTSTTLNAKDCEIGARPTQTGKYTKPWDAYRAAQRLFKEELDELGGLLRDKKDKGNFGVHTKALRQWWSTLFKEKKDEAGAAAKKWNEGEANRGKQSV